MTDFGKIALTLILGWLVSSLYAKQKPNIVLIMADDMGYECVQANGCEDYRTPHIDKLAKEGLRFTQCFANPKCTPSRVKLMTGMYNARNYTKFGELERSQTTFAHLLKEQGYATVIAGKWQLGPEKDSPHHFGFDQACLWQHTRGRHRKGEHKGLDSRYPNPQLEINGEEMNYTNGEYGPDICSDFICDFIKENKDKPFFAYYPMILPHWPFCPTPDSKDWDPQNMGSETNKGPGDETDQNRHFKEMVEHVDKITGKILLTLNDEGIRKNTIVIFLGDNGTDKPIITTWNQRQIAGDKGSTRDEGTRVTCIVSWPESIQPGVNTTELVEFSDFLPTLCDITGAKLPEHYPGDGASLSPVLFKSGKRTKEYISLRNTNTIVRNLDYGISTIKGEIEYVYHKYSGHYNDEIIDITKADTDAQKAFSQMLPLLEKLKNRRKKNKD